MGNKRKQYVKEKDIKKCLKNCDILLLLGERSNGKSYASKNLVMREIYNHKKEFIYLRRYDLDTKDSLCVGYFGDSPVETMTDNKYSCVDVWRKGIYLSNTDNNGKIKHGEKLGYCHALNNAEHYKSLAFPEVDYIIFEEFVSQDGRYLFNEPSKLQQYISTIFRHRKGKVILIGNTISRICPYYNDWNLKISKQKLGTIENYVFHNDNGEDTRLSVYLTDSLNYNSGMFFGLPAKNITKGAYDVIECPHLPKNRHQYATIYQLVIEYNEFKFLASFLQDKNDNSFCWYIEPKTTEIKANTRVISNKFSPNPLYTSNLRQSLNASEEKILRFFNKGTTCYSDNLTGTEFQNIIQFMR